MKLRYLFAALCLCLLLASPVAAAGGSGTEASPYIIETAAELQSMQNNLGAYYQLANDIDLSAVTWTPIGSTSAGFYGSFDGNGKTIKNLVLNAGYDSAGFFGMVTSGGIIKDITFQDCHITSSNSWCGVVIGSIIMSSSQHNTAIISNVDCVRCSATAAYNSVGCIVGLVYISADVKISDCDLHYCSAESINNDNVGCIVGDCNGQSSTEIINCNVLDSYTHSNGGHLGGIAGWCNSASSLMIDSSTVQNSIVSSNVGSAGGIIGTCYYSGSSVIVSNSQVSNCLIESDGRTAGIIGDCRDMGSIIVQTCIVTDCTIVASNTYAGGIAAIIEPTSSGVFNSCTVTGCTILATSYAATICPAFS